MTDFDLRSLATPSEFAAAVTLQRQTWGADFAECVPHTVLRLSQDMGGIVAGAFDADDRMVGFVYGVSGVRDGRPAHWSHMLAVDPVLRSHGLGTRLKTFQRVLLLEAGIGLAYWTYDPLIAGNAHLNLNRLGARPVQYIVNLYGTDTGSELHSALGTDRFIVEWPLEDPAVTAALARAEDPRPGPDLDAPVVNRDPTGTPGPPRSTDATRVRVDIPLDVMRLWRQDPAQATAWGEATREAFTHYLDRGYRVIGFHRDRATNHAGYLLAHPLHDQPS